jgi:HEAT repeat protein
VARAELPAVEGGAPARVQGRQRKFDLVLETALESGRDPVTVAVRGVWVATVTSVATGNGAGKFDVGYVLENPQVTGGGVSGVSAADVRKLARQLGRGFYVTYDASGAAVRAYFPRDVEPSVRNLLELAVTASQLVWARAPAPEWRTMERDGAGAYWASYRRLGPLQIVKTKLQYLDADGASGLEDGNTLSVRVGASEARFSVDASGNITALDANETTHLDLQIRGAELGVKVALHLSNARGGEAPELVGALDRHRAELESVPIQTAHADVEAKQAEEDARLIGSASPDEVIAGMKGAKPEDSAAIRLQALVRLQPAVIPKVVALLKQGDQPMVFAEVLGAAGTPAAQSALVALAHDQNLAKALRIDAMTALARVPRPTIQTSNSLRDLNEVPDPELRRASSLMSAALAHAVREEHPETAALLESELVDQYRKARDEEARLDLLAALGNAAGPGAAHLLAEAIRDTNARIRAGAARALRLVTEPEADRLLAAAISGDKDAQVRAAAIFAAGYRSLAPFIDVLIRAMKADTADYVRNAAMALAGAHRNTSPKIDEALLFVAEHDPKPALRRVARDIAARR